MNLSIRQLLTFREVMRSGSLSEAARNLGRTQPSVSAQIASLEAELEFKLFERKSGKLIPTPEASYVLEEAESVLIRLERTKTSLANVRRQQKGKIRIACYPAASSYFLPQLLQDFLADKPEVEVSLMMRASSTIEDLIASQQFDIGILERPEPRNSFEQVDIDLRCMVAMGHNDSLANRSEISPNDLAGKPMAVLFDSHHITQQTERAFTKSGAQLWKRFELQTFLPGLGLVEGGLCYMICDRVTAHSYMQRQPSAPKLVFKEFAPAINGAVSIVWPAHRSISMVSDQFVALIHQAMLGLKKQ